MRVIESVRRAACLALLSGAAWAQPGAGSEGGATMYRCPGNDYNNTISAREAKDRGCRTLEGGPVSVIQTVKPRTGGTGAPAASTPASSGVVSSVARIDPAAQRSRDSDARRILETELRTEEEKLAGLVKEYNNGEPERQGNERNFQKYLDRVADMKAAIQRKESDVAAIRRELGKVPK